MTRTTALWGIVITLALGWGSLALAQQPVPASAANDSLKTSAEEAKPATREGGPTEMQATQDEAREHRRGDDRLKYYVSLGLGGSVNYLPDDFRDGYDPSYGVRVGSGVAFDDLRVGVTMAYNFFLSRESKTIFPNDLNILTIFGEVKYIPIGSTIRPYILAAGGYFRQWIVNTGYTENVLGYGGGAGLELSIDDSRHLHIEGRYIQGRTRQTQEKANTELIPFGIGLVWVF